MEDKTIARRFRYTRMHLVHMGMVLLGLAVEQDLVDIGIRVV